MIYDSVLVSGHPQQLRIAVLRQGEPLAFFYGSLTSTEPLLDDIYKAKIINLTESFVWLDLGSGKTGVMKARSTPSFQQGQKIIVQVIREALEDIAAPSQTKGVRLSSAIHLAGRYCVYNPQQQGLSFSPSLTAPTRQNLKNLFSTSSSGITFRSVCEKEPSADVLQKEILSLTTLWQTLSNQTSSLSQRLYQAPSILARLLREAPLGTIFIIDDWNVLQYCQHQSAVYSEQKFSLRMALQNERPLFEHFGMEEIWQGLCEKKIPLPGGGNICIEETACAVTIDINAGNQSGEKVNQAAIPVILDHIAWRGLSGNIIIDFIESGSKHKEKLLHLFQKYLQQKQLKRIKILGWSPLGFLQLQSRRQRASLTSEIMKRSFCKD